MNITLRQISYFVATAEEGAISAAAAALGISQSAITESVRALELQTGVALFARHSKGVTLTYQGHQFLRHSRLILAAVADAARAVDATKPESISGTLTLGVTSLVAGYFLADVLAQLRRVFPKLVVKVVEEDRSFIEHLVVNGELQVALMLTSNLANQDALESEVLVRSSNRVWLSAGHPLVARKQIALAEIAQEPVIGLMIDEMAQTCRGIWRPTGLHPNIVLKTSSVEAVRSLVATGAGIAVLPDIAFRQWSLEGDRLEVRPLEDSVPTVDVGVVWRRGSMMAEPASVFLALARGYRTIRHLTG
ncbi:MULTISPECIES: LysR substrate-binding domain-containing protein [unclassified Mesorhizobium]|uniref:LysR substrate-binding domain-containing protein n=1 Tax=unclassified Mesorhizobium TaxID=325217 RepID=UPI00333B2E20